MINPTELKKVDIELHQEVVFVGYGNKILVYKAENYETYRTTSFLSFDTLYNFWVRICERFSLPEIT